MLPIVTLVIFLHIATRVFSENANDIDLNENLGRGSEFFGPNLSNFGTSLNYAGDINGDSIDDFIVGSPGENAAYVFYGHTGFSGDMDIANFDSSKGFKITSAILGNFGLSVSFAGDVNHDGIDDIIVGAPTALSSQNGAVYVIYGKRGGVSDIDITAGLSSRGLGFTISGSGTVKQLGIKISGGDLNGDGISDVVVGSTTTVIGRTGAGVVYVIYGKDGGPADITLPSGLISSKGFQIQGGQYYGIGASGISAAGDLNDDGIKDLVVGAAGAGRVSNGMVFIIHGRQGGGFPSTIDLAGTLNSTEIVNITGYFGYSIGASVAPAGDVNGDGVDDIIIGSSSANFRSVVGAGVALVVYGKSGGLPPMDLYTNTLNVSEGFYIGGSYVNGQFGWSVGGGFDLNADGLDDVIVGSPYASPLSRTNAGGVYIIFGQAGGVIDTIDLRFSLNESQGFMIKGPITSDTSGWGTNLGWAVASAGDIDNDGYSDTLLATKTGSIPGRSSAGIVYLLSSGSNAANLNSTAQSGRDKLSPVADIISNIVTVGVFIQAAVEPSNSNGIEIGSLSKIFEFTRYYDVSRSSNLDIFYKTHRRVPATITIGSGLSEDTIKEFHGDNLPHPFVTNGLYSSFLVNFFKSLETLLILLGIVLFVVGIEMIINKRLSKFSKYAKMGRLAVINYLITQYYNVFGDIFFFGVLDYMTLAPEGAVDWISFFLAILFNLFGLFVLFLHYRLLRQYQAQKREATDEKIQKFEEYKRRHENVELLYKNFKDISFLHQSYILFITIRLAICALTMTVLYTHPIAQAIINIVENIAILLYIGRKMFFKNRSSLIQQLAFEIDLLLVNICFLVSACLDDHGTSSDESRYPLGQIIIIGIFVSKFFGFITLVPTAIDYLRDLLKKPAEQKKVAEPAKDTPEEGKEEPEPITPIEIVLETEEGLIPEKSNKSKRGSKISIASEYDLEELDDGQASPVSPIRSTMTLTMAMRQSSMQPLQSP